MFEIGDFVIYGNEGVCKVEEIGSLNMPGVSNDREYYTLKTINENSKIFAPVDSKVFMRSISTQEEVKELIKKIPSIESLDCSNKNIKVLQSTYIDCIKSHDCETLLSLILGIQKKKIEENNKGKKLGQVDDKFLKTAQDLINSEFSVALGTDKKEMSTRIEKEIENNI